MKKVKGYVSIILGIVSCVGHFNFQGAFFFLHIVNPVLFLLYYMFFIDDDKCSKKILYTPIPVIIYLLLDYIIGRVTGYFVYGIFNVNEMNLALMIFVVCGICIILIVLAGITQFINRKCNIIRKELHI